MKLTKQTGTALFLLNDYVAAMIAWGVMFVFRKTYFGGYDLGVHNTLIFDNNFYIGIFTIPLFWIAIYFITGTYHSFFRKSRLTVLFKTFLTTLVGVTFLFYVLFLDDEIDDNYLNYYRAIGVLFSLHFLLTTTGRLMILNYAKSLVSKGLVGYNTIIVGGNEKALNLYKEIMGGRKTHGYRFLGFIDLNGNGNSHLSRQLPLLGAFDDLNRVIMEKEIEEVIVAVESSEHHLLQKIINAVSEERIIIKITPDMYDILSGSVKMTNVIGAPLIEIYPDLIPVWQKLLKRTMDFVASATVLLLLSPFYLLIALRVRLSSSGSLLYKQERIGLNGKPFTMFKFRSMFVNSERNGPSLSSDNDKRITKWGKTMRKWRFDELPQFYNILKGDMSLVGPRPERRFFIDKIIEKAPSYKHLQKAKPGITSWGMVKYGYAENVDQMIERMKYDLLYIENMSIAVDLKIMIYTVLIILQGKGK